MEGILKKKCFPAQDVTNHDGPAIEDMFPKIDAATAKEIDKMLHWRDAISLAFLIFDQDVFALKLSW